MVSKLLFNTFHWISIVFINVRNKINYVKNVNAALIIIMNYALHEPAVCACFAQRARPQAAVIQTSQAGAIYACVDRPYPRVHGSQA
jgi:hypothetical protein